GPVRVKVRADQRHGALDADKGTGVVLLRGNEKGPRMLRVAEAPAHQHLGEDVADTEISLQPPRGPEIVVGDPKLRIRCPCRRWAVCPPRGQRFGSADAEGYGRFGHAGRVRAATDGSEPLPGVVTVLAQIFHSPVRSVVTGARRFPPPAKGSGARRAENRPRRTKHSG